MLQVQRAVIIAACIAGTACSSDDATGVDGPPLPLGDTVVATTAADGRATVTFQGQDDNEYQIAITLQDFDTERGASGLEVHAIALADGVFLRTEDPRGGYFASTQYVSYSQFQTGGPSASIALGDSGGPVPPSPVAIVAIYRLAIAVFAVGSALYEYATDPPGLQQVFDDRGTERVCLTGDLNDVFGAWSASGVRTVSGAIRIFGAPARVRGVTSINLGFTRLSVYQQFNREGLQVLVDNYTGLLDTDVTVWCWPVVGGRVIPVIRGDVTRSATAFDIVRVLSQATYPVMPTFSQVTTSAGAEWAGTPAFPVQMIVTPVACYAGWTCHGSNQRFDTSQNPLRVQFGCWGSNPASRSGSMTFRMQLRDRNGVTTPPATLNFRCGGSADAASDAGFSTVGAPGGFAGAGQPRAVRSEPGRPRPLSIRPGAGAETTRAGDACRAPPRRPGRNPRPACPSLNAPDRGPRRCCRGAAPIPNRTAGHTGARGGATPQQTVAVHPPGACSPNFFPRITEAQS